MSSANTSTDSKTVFLVNGDSSTANLYSSRLEQAIQGIDSIREMIVGAFDLYMTRTAQYTNDVMKVLTIVSVLLLPASLLAGIFGMNMLPEFFLHACRRVERPLETHHRP